MRKAVKLSLGSRVQSRRKNTSNVTFSLLTYHHARWKGHSSRSLLSWGHIQHNAPWQSLSCVYTGTHVAGYKLYPFVAVNMFLVSSVAGYKGIQVDRDINVKFFYILYCCHFMVNKDFQMSPRYRLQVSWTSSLYPSTSVDKVLVVWDTCLRATCVLVWMRH